MLYWLDFHLTPITSAWIESLRATSDTDVLSLWQCAVSSSPGVARKLLAPWRRGLCTGGYICIMVFIWGFCQLNGAQQKRQVWLGTHSGGIHWPKPGSFFPSILVFLASNFCVIFLCFYFVVLGLDFLFSFLAGLILCNIFMVFSKMKSTRKDGRVWGKKEKWRKGKWVGSRRSMPREARADG